MILWLALQVLVVRVHGPPLYWKRGAQFVFEKRGNYKAYAIIPKI